MSWGIKHSTRDLWYTSRGLAAYTSLRRFASGSRFSSVLVSTFKPFLIFEDGACERFEGPSPSGFALFREVTTTPFNFALAVTGRVNLVAVDGVAAGGDAVGFTKLGIGGWDEDAAFAATALCRGVWAIPIRCKGGHR